MRDKGFSIIVPAYNSERTICNCLKRILEYKDQGDEVIVVDNCSSDSTAELVKSFSVKLFVCEKRGAAAARNFGVQHAEHDNIIFVDSDVMIAEDSIKKIKSRLLSTDISAVNGIYSSTAGNNSFMSKFQNIYTYNNYMNIGGKKRQLVYNSFWASFSAVKRDAFKEVGGFNEKLSALEDIEFGVRMTNKGYKVLFDKNIQNFHDHNFTVKKFFMNYYTKTKAWVCVSMSKDALKYEGYDDIRPKLSLLLANLFMAIVILSFFLIKPFGLYPLGVAGVVFGFFSLNNNELLITAKKTYGFRFMLLSAPTLVLSYVFIAVGIVGGFIDYLWDQLA